MVNGDPSNGNHLNDGSSKSVDSNISQRKSPYDRVWKFLALSREKSGQTPARLAAAGFRYIDDGNTIQCDHSKLRISNWTVDMEPFTIHVQRMPTCAFLQSIKESFSFPFNKSYLSPNFDASSSMSI